MSASTTKSRKSGSEGTRLWRSIPAGTTAKEQGMNGHKAGGARPQGL